MDVATGYNTRYIGTQSFQNNGIEVELKGTPVQTQSFTWSPSINFTYVKNKVLGTDKYSYYPGVRYLQTIKRKPCICCRFTQVRRLWQPITNVMHQAKSFLIQTVYRNQNGVRTPHGTTVPKIYGGFNNDFSYKHINLSFLIDYRFGNKVLSATNYYSTYRGLNKSTLPGREGGVVGDGVTEDGQKKYQIS